MFCGKCGSKLDGGSLFCPNCGWQTVKPSGGCAVEGGSLLQNLITKIRAEIIAEV